MQAPIGPATSWELVAAVTAAGGLGTLAASWTELGELRDQIGRVRSAVSKPFCVNLVLAFDQRERLDLALACGVPVVSFSWGVDPLLIGLAREAGVTVLVQVGDLAHAKAAAAAGANGLIAQGVEAGGHVEGTAPLLALVGEIRSVGLPVIAAGGIADGPAAQDAIKAGARAVACGTAFLAATEADVHPDYQARIVAAEALDTQLTDLFDVGWPNAPHRVIRNSTLVSWELAGTPSPGSRSGEGEVIAERYGSPIVRYSDAQPTRLTNGDVEAMAMYAGTSVSHVRQIAPASAITTRIALGIR